MRSLELAGCRPYEIPTLSELSSSDRDPSRVPHPLAEQHLQDGGGRHGEDRAEDAEQVAADQQRDDHGHGADPDLPLHDLRHEHVVLELLLHDEEDDDAEHLLRATPSSATAIAGIAERIGPTTGIISPMPEISAST